MLQAATRSRGPTSPSRGPHLDPSGGPCPGGLCCKGEAPITVGAAATATTTGAEARECCAGEAQFAAAGGEEAALEAYQKGRGTPRGPSVGLGCLESVGSAELLQHALLLWAGAWLLKSCRPAVRQAVLGHFITRM